MEKIEKHIIEILINSGKLPKSASEEIAEKMEIGLTFGEVLIGDNYTTEADLISLLSNLYKNGHVTLDEISDNFFIDKETFLSNYANKFGMTYMNLNNIDIDYRIAERSSLAQLKKYGALPIKEDDLNIYVAFKSPFDVASQDRIQGLFKRKLLKVVFADPDHIDKYLSKISLSESIRGTVIEIRKELASTSDQGGADGTTSSGILKLIETIIKQSIISRGSDIHIEPTETNCIVRTRIDGMLTEIFMFDRDIYPPLVSRLKLLSNMDIAERRRPQDGRFSMNIGENEYDFRISTLPIINGESIVMRILDKSKILINLDKLGMHPENLRKFNTAMKAPYGIILVTGPTGSGKSTTLYAALNDIKNVTTKIITVEDPVEYQLNLIQQVHVNEKAGLTFAGALRSILRQDPDVIMIGEIRDQETLRIAIQSALTGHLVFSTLHTNDAISSIPRMIDMGIEPYLISGSIMAIEAQRLVRKLCPKCKQTVNLPKSILDDFKEKYSISENYQFYKAVGCQECSGTGYAGREMISEVLPISQKIQSIIAVNGSKDELQKVATEEGFIDMFQDGIIKASKGVTSIEEIYRVAKE
ncbi:MAG: type II/IV secretion system protein [Campylobacter sp.]|nr:type II/IV secretion system protein [Campylobacter sp.]